MPDKIRIIEGINEGNAGEREKSKRRASEGCVCLLQRRSLSSRFKRQFEEQFVCPIERRNSPRQLASRRNGGQLGSIVLEILRHCFNAAKLGADPRRSQLIENAVVNERLTERHNLNLCHSGLPHLAFRQVFTNGAMGLHDPIRYWNMAIFKVKSFTNPNNWDNEDGCTQ
jgi:hypothetical protein